MRVLQAKYTCAFKYIYVCVGELQAEYTCIHMCVCVCVCVCGVCASLRMRLDVSACLDEDVDMDHKFGCWDKDKSHRFVCLWGYDFLCLVIAW